MYSGNLFRSPFFWFLAILLVAELVATEFNPYRNVPAASEVSRNPLPLRGVPEFLRAGPGSIDVINVAIVSNSQGVSSEVGDTERTYPALLEQSFRSDGHRINIENWSLSGLRTDQIELLSMVAVQRQLDLLLIVTEIKSLDIYGSVRFGANADDLDLVAGDPTYWPGIHASQVLENTKWDDLLQRFLTLHSKLIRTRPHMLDLLAREITPAEQRLLFGHRRSPRALEPIRVSAEPTEGNTPREMVATAITVPASTWEKQFRRNRVPTFNALFPGLRQRLLESGTTVVWIWMPIYPGANTLALREGAKPVYAEICGEIEDAGVRCINLVDSLTTDEFVTLSASSHFNLAGHESMSQLLRPVIKHALH